MPIIVVARRLRSNRGAVARCGIAARRHKISKFVATLTAVTLQRGSRPRLVLALVGAGALAGGCANPFLSNYSGARCPPVNTAHVSVGPPASATLIGTSDFVTDVAIGNVQAIAAAERVGADIVQWDRAFLRHDVPLLHASLAGDGMAPAIPAGAGQAPVEFSGTWYRFHARFWRSDALGGIPAAPVDSTAATTTADAPSSAPPAAASASSGSASAIADGAS